MFRILKAVCAWWKMLAKKGLWNESADSLCFALQVAKRVGGHSPVQALQQTERVCSDETSTWVSSQTRYVCTDLLQRRICVGWAWRERSQNMFSSFVSSLADIPVFPTITATVTFQEFRYDEFEESIFVIPADYKEDPSRFPDLWPVNATGRNRKRPARENVWEVGRRNEELYNPFFSYI